MIQQEIHHLQATLETNIRILDVGSGTGRVAEFLLQDHSGIDYIGVDFSGCMIRKAVEKLGAFCEGRVAVGKLVKSEKGKSSISFFKAPAEKLSFLQHQYSSGFDLAILGFGFLSYVNYLLVMPPVDANHIDKEAGILALLKKGGKTLISVYNDSSAIYDRIRYIDDSDDKLPLAAVMDINKGKLIVGKYAFNCEPFSVTILAASYEALKKKKNFRVREASFEVFIILQ